MSKIEEIKEEIKGLFKSVEVVQTTDTKKLYEDLVKCVEDWMHGIDIIGKVKWVIYQKDNRAQTNIFVTFNFGKKRFSITTGEDSDEYMCLGLFSKSLEPQWYSYYIKVLAFYGLCTFNRVCTFILKVALLFKIG